MAGFVLNVAGLNQVLRSPSGPVYADLTKRCIRVNNQARRLVKVRTGRLRNSIRWYIAIEQTGPVGYVGSDLVYAAANHAHNPWLLDALPAAL